MTYTVCDNCGAWADTGCEYCGECLSTVVGLTVETITPDASGLLKGWRV